MTRRYAQILISILLLLVSFPPIETVPPSHAYVLHGYHLLDLMRREMGTARSLEVIQKLTIQESVLSAEAVAVQETLSYRFPVAFRSEFVSAAGEHIQIFSNGRALTVVDRRIVSDTESDLDHYKDIFLFNTRELLKNRLSQLGVAAEVSSVGRFQGRVGYILGAQYPDETVPQLWLDKETFRPMRWLLKPAAAGTPSEALEVRYFDWRKLSSIWYPERIEFYQGDRLLRRMQVQRTRVNPELSNRLFDLTYLKSIYPFAVTPPAAQGESGGKNDIQRTIDRFRKLFE
jgi:outer membrane lipoprotein-sorting protein